MVNVLPLRHDLVQYLKKRELFKRFQKQQKLFLENPFHSSLNTELMEPKHLGVYSFRITRNWRAIFIYRGRNEIEIIDINNHYR